MSPIPVMLIAAALAGVVLGAAYGLWGGAATLALAAGGGLIADAITTAVRSWRAR